MKRIYVDTEYMYEGMFHEKRPALDTDKKQIIQIAAVLFDTEKGIELEHFNILVKPVFHTKLPDFFVELTGIDYEKVEAEAVSFSEALDNFLKFCGDHPIWTFNNDYNVFLQNFSYHSIENPFKKPFTRVNPLLANYGIDSSKYSSGTLYKAVGLNLSGHVHNALHDVRSMSKAMHILEKTNL